MNRSLFLQAGNLPSGNYNPHLLLRIWNKSNICCNLTSKGNLKPALETFQTYYTPSPMITDLLKVPSHPQCYFTKKRFYTKVDDWQKSCTSTGSMDTFPSQQCHCCSRKCFKCLLQENPQALCCSSVSNAMSPTLSNSSRLLSPKTMLQVGWQDKPLKLISIKCAPTNCLPYSTVSLITLNLKKKSIQVSNCLTFKFSGNVFQKHQY